MASFTRRPQAKRDLIDIWNYVADYNLDAADRVLDKIDNTCSILARYPFIGRARQEIDSSVFSFPVGKYLIFYEPCDNGIDIIRILHGSRDIESQF
ncbi:MAG: type II toxin-antitoxin system RelE/ParE family toxin [Alphaproteobacteria bacterium]|jgi:toxin ParE1/3/4|nr:type II toxin-antitoxin system RelE/ParE family toxin [Alphaproteobacteria bacterium]